MKKRRFTSTQERGRRLAAEHLTWFLRAADKPNISQHMNGVLAGLLFCGALSKFQYERLTNNIHELAWPPMDRAAQVKEATEGRR
jgi:peptide subunit release factor RF-3